MMRITALNDEALVIGEDCELKVTKEAQVDFQKST